MRTGIDVYLNEIDKYGPLTVEEEQELGKTLSQPETPEDDKKYIREKIINHNLKYVVKLAREYKLRNGYSSVPFEDLVGAGNTGLMLAIEKWDWRMGRFLTYADAWIRRQIQKFRNKAANLIDKPDYVTNAIVHIRKLQGELEQVLSRDPSPEELATALDGAMSKEKIEQLLVQMGSSVVSLDASPTIGMSSEDDITYNEVIPSDTLTPMENKMKLERSKTLKLALEKLPLVNRRVLELSFGLTESGEKTFEEISEILFSEGMGNKGSKYTKQNISLIKNKGIELIQQDTQIMEALVEYMKVA